MGKVILYGWMHDLNHSMETQMKTYKYATLPAAVAMMLASLGANAATPGHCYDFSRMSEDASYSVGDVIETDHATITLKQYVYNGNPTDVANSRAERASSQIAGGASPELELKLVALNIVPKRPVHRITARVAQNIAQDGGFGDSGIGVNRKGAKSQQGFAGLNGRVLGNSRTGKAKFTTDIAPTGGANWQSGTIEFTAVKGSIKSIRLGAHTWRADNVCLYPNP